MARIQIDKIVTNISGAPLQNASITISNLNFPATPVRTVYVAATGAATLPTPLLTGADGSIPGFVNPGTYSFGITPQGQATYFVQVDTPSGGLTVRNLPSASSEWEGQIVTISGANTTYICQYNGTAYIWQIMSFSAATPISSVSLGGDLQGTSTFATVMYVRGATPVLSWKGRAGSVLPTAGDYLASQVSNAADKATPMSQIFQGPITSPFFQATGLIGATPQSRWVGGGLSATPVSTGTSFQAGDFISMQSGNMAVYNGASWVVSGQSSGGGGGGGTITSVFSRAGPAISATTGDYSAFQVTGAADKSTSAQQTFTGPLAAPWFTATPGVSGTATPARFAGGVIGSAPANPNSGSWNLGDFVTDGVVGTGYIFTSTGFSTLMKSPRVIREQHTFALGGNIATPLAGPGDPVWIPPMFVSLGANETVKLVKARYMIGSGNIVTAKLQKNNADITGFTGLNLTPISASVTPTGVSLAEDDQINLVLTGVLATPANGVAFTMNFERTIS